MKQLTNHTKKFLVLLALLLLPFLLLTNIPQAEALNCTPKNSPPNWVFVNGKWVRAHGVMCAGQDSGSTTGVCLVKTYTSPGESVNYVGWTNWQCDLIQGHTVINSKPHIGSPVNWNSAYKEDLLFWEGAYNTTGRRVAVSGQHDANHNGASPSPWRALNNANYP